MIRLDEIVHVRDNRQLRQGSLQLQLSCESIHLS